MNDEELLKARLFDRARNADRHFKITALGFLTPAEMEMLISVTHSGEFKALSVLTKQDGGYENAERCMLFLKPNKPGCEYLSYDEAREEYISAVRIHASGFDKKLSHRDYLGSLMAIGIKRETLGDILPYTLEEEQYCDILTFPQIADHIITSLETVGRAKVKTEVINLDKLHIPDIPMVEVKATVASLRLDAVLSAGFNISRSEAKDKIDAGLVTRNYLLELSPERQLDEGDRISLRGDGKFVLTEIGGETRKQRIRIIINKYV